jgi:serine/threonine protein kinase
MSEKSGGTPIGLTGPALGPAGTAGHLPSGYLLRDFRVEQVLGEGGFSVVYLATDLRLEREVAIKEYMPTALATRNPDLSVQVRSSAQHRDAFEAGLRSFVNEAKLLAHFEHRALVKVHQFWQEKGTAYMVMPVYGGPTLKNWVRQRITPIDSAWVERFLLLLMDALETLHRENCLHRDVAPDNILVLDESRPLLLDFGAARRVIGDLTQALTVILKPGFAPIEQYAESASMRQGAWTDVYALCAVAHHMITGRAPTPAVTRVLADDLVPLSVVAAGQFPPPFLAALDAGLTVRPQQRPQTIAALRALMNGAAPDNTVTTPPGREGAASARQAPATLRSVAPPDDDERTLLVGGRDPLPPTGTNTISTPSTPASSGRAHQATGSPTPMRSVQPSLPAASEPSPTSAGPESDRWIWLPYVIGAIAIAGVVIGAWYLVDWLNAQADLTRRRTSAAPPASVVVAFADASRRRGDGAELLQRRQCG